MLQVGTQSSSDSPGEFGRPAFLTCFVEHALNPALVSVLLRAWTIWRLVYVRRAQSTILRATISRFTGIVRLDKVTAASVPVSEYFFRTHP